MQGLDVLLDISVSSWVEDRDRSGLLGHGAPVRTLGLSVVLALSVSCRDEQAGPRPRTNAPPPPGAPPAAAPSGSIRTLDAVPGTLNFPSTASWSGGAVKYLGSSIEPKNPQPGQPVTLKHYFRADGQQPQGYRFFVHVVDGNSGQMLGNMDHELQGGAAMLGAWPAGKVIEDVQQIAMPNYPGPMQLLIGFWRGDERLSADLPPTHDGNHRVFGPRLEGPQAALPEYKMPKTPKPITVDGKLDDPQWASAPEVTLTTSFDGKETRRKTRARLLWDDTNIYVGFDCDDPDVWGTLRNKDDAIYNQDVVEVFFDADADGATYNELQVSPHNVNFDASFVARRSDLEAAMKWESGMTTAVNVRGTLDDDKEDQGWSAEMQIPIANLNKVPHVPPVKGDKWRFNAYRLEHFVHFKEIEGQSFSPLFVGDFHALPRFGWLVFE